MTRDELFGIQIANSIQIVRLYETYELEDSANGEEGSPD